MKEERMNSWQWAKHAELYSDYSGLRLRISEERGQSYVLTTSGFICGFLKREDKAIFLPRASSVDFWRERTKLYSDYSGLHLWIFEERGQGYILTTPGFNCGFLKREDLRFCTRGANVTLGWDTEQKDPTAFTECDFINITIEQGSNSVYRVWLYEHYHRIQGYKDTTISIREWHNNVHLNLSWWRSSYTIGTVHNSSKPS